MANGSEHLERLEFNCFGCRKPVLFTTTICDTCNEASRAVPVDTSVVVTRELLDRLRMTSGAASPKNWEVWINTHGDPVVVPAGGTGFLRICDTSKSPDDYGRANNAHIADADPATVEALVEHIEALTAQLDDALARARELGAGALERFAEQWDTKLHADGVLEPWLPSLESEAMRAEAARIRTTVPGT